MTRTLAFLGPRGTFTEKALMSQPDLAHAEHVLYRTMPDVLDAVERGEVHGRCGGLVSSIRSTRPDWVETTVLPHSTSTMKTLGCALSATAMPSLVWTLAATLDELETRTRP